MNDKPGSGWVVGADASPQRQRLVVDILPRQDVRQRRFRTNCWRIEIPLLLPVSAILERDCNTDDRAAAAVAFPAPTTPPTETSSLRAFPFLSLPMEIRLQIYALLLPSRTHVLISQYPHSGSYYYTTPLYSAQTLYPAWLSGTQARPEQSTKLTTYRLLNANSQRDLPNPSIHTAILRTCRQVHDEAEGVLYGIGTVFDFGMYIDAVVPFFSDRSAAARHRIHKICLAREIWSDVLYPGDTLGQDSNLKGAFWDLLREYLPLL
ncbi:MAG: hypothetical protein M1818_005507 [Claussenomyces sp. TS43310]|nr:MAG: hypothetical protein M1818_005507 [Claussenomyces sp. TS43310]